MRRAILAGAVLLARGACAETLFVESAMVVPVDGKPIPHGRLVVQDGKITEVGADVERPPFSRRIDATRQWITPGFVVPASRLSLPAATPPGPEEAARVAVDVAPKAADELYPLAPEFALLLDQGITTVGLLPGQQVGVNGQVSAVSTKAAKPGDMVLAPEAAVHVVVATHGGWRDALGQAFEKAEEAAKAKAKKKGKADAKAAKTKRAAGKGAAAPTDKKPSGSKDGAGERDKDPWARLLLEQERLFAVPFTPAGWVAMQDVLPLEDLDVVIFDGADLYPLAGELHEHGVRVITYPALVRAPRTRMPVNRAAEYEAAGVPYAFTLPFDSARGAAILRDAALEMIRTGCDRDKVLAALTKEPADMLGIEEVVGSIAKGRRADLLFWDGDPLTPTSRLERVMVGGEFVARQPGPPGAEP